MQFVLITLLTLSVGSFLTAKKLNNVCKTYLDYYLDMQKNPNCYYNPDMYLSATQIIERHGYPVETYTATTPDGYILTIFRIPHGKSTGKNIVRQAVFVQHGIGASSIVFIDRGPKSLAFILADNGYDVWLGNFRGMQYSEKHQTLNVNDPRYWNFSFDELGTYDVPTQLDVVAKNTAGKTVYLGYSMGTTAYFIYNSKFPEEAKKRLKLAISMAPVAFLHHTRTIFKIFAPFWPIYGNFLYNISGGALTRRTPTNVRRRGEFCLPDPIKMNFCLIISYLLFGYDASQRDPGTLPITTMRNFDAAPVKCILHNVQLVQSTQFRRYDYGKENMNVYGTREPPEYNLSAINVPNYLIWGDNDLIATRKNVEKLYDNLPKAAKPFPMYLVKYSPFSHLDFDSAKDVKELVYEHIVEVLKNNASELK